MMNKYKKTNCPAREAMNADGSRFLPLATLAVIAGILFFAPALIRGEEMAVFEKLKDEDPSVRSAEALRLGIEKVRESVPALIEALKDEMTGVRINAVVALGRIGDERALMPLRDILNNDPVPAARMKAAEALASFGKGTADADILKAAESEDENVRVSAVKSLGKTGGEAAVHKLIEKAQSDAQWRVRQEAVKALSVHVAGAESGEIEKALKRIAKKDDKPQVREEAKRALNKIPRTKKKWWFF